MPRTDATTRSIQLDRAGGGAAIVWALVALQWFPVAVGVLLVSRRLGGAIASPLPARLLLGTAVGLLGWAIALCAVGRLNDHAFDWQRLAASPIHLLGPVRWLPAVAMLLFAAGCSYPFGRPVDWAAWLPVFAVEYWLVRRRRGDLTNAPGQQQSVAALQDSNGLTSEMPIQQLTRHRAADGSESIRGTMTADFVIGQRSATLFVAFCPPFARLPAVEAHVTDDWPAEVKVTQRLHHGAQLEVRLTEPAEDEFRLQVEMYAAETNTN